MPRISGSSFQTRSEVLARRGMVATSQPLASQAGLDILERGGTAADAAIAANAVLGLVEPTGCGLGGDLFAIVWDAARKKLDGLNASGRSPQSLTLDHLRSVGVDKIPSTGGLSVSVPGCVDGWYKLHERYGQLAMSALLAPAIGYARDGFPVSEVVAESWRRDAEALHDFPGFRETFMPGGMAPDKGSVFHNPALARTLEIIAADGADGFYRGGVAAIIARAVHHAGGFLSVEDLERHRSDWVAPVSTSYRGFDVWELPPNGQGIAALQILNLMEGFDVRSMGFGGTSYLHHLVEAKKLAYEDRARFYADPDFAQAPIEALISKSYADERRTLIDPDRAAISVEPGEPALCVGDTVYLTTADRDGNMVSLIQSNFRGMGSGVCPDGLGFGLQDRGELFSLKDGHANVYAPGKRPFHTIIPGFVTRDGAPVLSFGVMGGDVQPQMHAQILMNIIDFEMNYQAAGDAPRTFHSGSSEPTGSPMADGGWVHLEEGFSRTSVEGMTERGHRLAEADGGFGGYQAIGVDENGTYYGASESRKDGHAVGY